MVILNTYLLIKIYQTSNITMQDLILMTLKENRLMVVFLVLKDQRNDRQILFAKTKRQLSQPKKSS